MANDSLDGRFEISSASEIPLIIMYQLKMESSALCTAVLESANDTVRSQLIPIEPKPKEPEVGV